MKYKYHQKHFAHVINSTSTNPFLDCWIFPMEHFAQ